MARRAAFIVAAVASLVAGLSLLMPYAELGGVSASGFKLLTRADTLLLVASLIAAAALAGAAVTGARPLGAIGLVAAGVALGGLVFTGMELVHQLGRPAEALPFDLDVVPDAAPAPETGAGVIVGIVASVLAALAALVGALLPEGERRARAEAADIARSPFAAQEPAPAGPVPAPAAPASAVPAGWYADPHGAGGRRYWDGERWTDHTRS